MSDLFNERFEDAGTAAPATPAETPTPPQADEFALAPSEHFTLRKGKPYVWGTWLKRLLSGRDVCGWKLWFKAHCKYEKITDDSFDTARWERQHNARVLERATVLRGQGYQVSREFEMKYESPRGLLTCKADIVARRTPAAPLLPVVLIDDVKTGNKQNEDYWQVLTYMVVYLKLLDLEAKRKGEAYAPAIDLTGEVIYRDNLLKISADEDVTPKNETAIWDLMKMAVAKDGPKRVPSRHECAFCDIPKTCCPDRIEAPKEKPPMGDDF
jgi:hypothetical protein